MFRRIHGPYPVQTRWMCEPPQLVPNAAKGMDPIYDALCLSRIIYDAPIIYEAFSLLIAIGRRTPFRADSLLSLTWGRPQPLQGWF